MKDTVAIIGSHPRTRSDFDFSRTDCDVWLFNEARSLAKSQEWAKKADVVFQMHDPVIWRNPANRNDPHHYAWLKEQTEATVYMQSVFEDVPMSAEYPLSDILSMNRTSKDGDHFLTSSVPQAMALAAYLGYKRVEIYGVAMETQTEYQYQREGVSYWYGYLKGKGCDVYFADSTFRAPLYGYEGYASIPDGVFEKRAAELKPEVERIGPEFYACKVMLTKELDAMLTTDNTEAVREAALATANKATEAGLADGAYQENLRYQKRMDVMKNASGSFLFSRQEFESAMQGLVKQFGEANGRATSVAGQLELVHQNIVRAAKGSPKRAKLISGYKQLADQWLQGVNYAAILQGAGQENYNYLKMLDSAVRAAGGVKSEAVLLANAV